MGLSMLTDMAAGGFWAPATIRFPVTAQSPSRDREGVPKPRDLLTRAALSLALAYPRAARHGPSVRNFEKKPIFHLTLRQKLRIYYRGVILRRADLAPGARSEEREVRSEK